MTRLLTLLLAAVSASAASLSPVTAPSARTAAELARLEAQAMASLTARRLFTATRRVPRREVRGSELPDAIGVRGGAAPEIVLDALRLPETTEIDAEILLVLNTARAELAFPIPVVEAEQAAWQKTLVFCAERGAEDPKGFGALLARAAETARASSASLERSALPARSPWELAETPALKLPVSALARAGLLLHLLDKDPQKFYWAVEAGAPWPRGAARLSELEDLFALRGKELAALKAPPAGSYAELGGRRYPAALALAAYRLRGTGEVERLRESLENYDGVGLASARVAINRWRRATAK